MAHHIAVIGGSYAGIVITHNLFKSIIPALPKTTKYTVTMISPSKQFLFTLAGLRAIVEPDLIDNSALFQDFLGYFDQYKETGSDGLKFVHGVVKSLEPVGKSLQVKLMDTVQTTTVKYNSLIIASGAATATPIFKLTNLDVDDAKQGMRELSQKVKSAHHIAIGGAGPLGVELASELAETYPTKKITLYAGSRGVLPNVPASYSQEIERRLRADFKVEIIVGLRVSRYEEESTGRYNSGSEHEGKDEVPRNLVKLHLTDGSTGEADLYIPASGETPNTSFIPKSFLSDDGRVDTDSQMRVPGASRVYALGDCIKLTRGVFDDVRDHAAVLKKVLIAELPVTDEVLSSSNVGDEVSEGYTLPDLATKNFVITLGRHGGLGMVDGCRYSSQLVRCNRARDMGLSTSRMVVAGDMC